MKIQLLKTFDNIEPDTHTEQVGRTSGVYLTDKLKYAVVLSHNESQVGDEVEFDVQVDAEAYAAQWVNEENT